MYKEIWSSQISTDYWIILYRLQNALTYAELDFPGIKQQRTKKRAKMKANRSEYASIDHTKVGTPLPESSSSEEDIFDYLPEGFLGNQDDEDNDTMIDM